MTNNNQQYTHCALCKKPLGETGIMATNPRSGKTAIMHQWCLKRESMKGKNHGKAKI